MGGLEPMRRGTAFRWIAATVIVALGIPLGPATAGVASATLGGRIVSLGDRAPLAGARVHVGEHRTKEIAVSLTTGEDGSFEITGLPPAAYDLAVESESGIYVVESPVRLEAGQRRTVQLAVSRAAANEGGGAKAGAKKSLSAWWNNPLTATLIVVGAAVIVGTIIGSSTNETPSSPSTP
jgi:hypothetical protein